MLNPKALCTARKEIDAVDDKLLELLDTIESIISDYSGEIPSGIIDALTAAQELMQDAKDITGELLEESILSEI